jgi:hypothetical protein
MSDILFAKVDLPILDKIKVTTEILSIDKKMWFWDRYRNTSMLSLMTRDSKIGKLGSSNFREGEFGWAEYTPTVLKEWFEDVVFPWMGSKTRIMALRTAPQFSNHEHIDSAEAEIGTRQHKFRLVLQGKTSTLYFKTNNGDLFVPDIEEPFIMDGSWPHGMSNTTNEVKLTLAAGAPWNGLNEYNNVDILLKKSDYGLPEDIKKYGQTQ